MNKSKSLFRRIAIIFFAVLTISIISYTASYIYYLNYTETLTLRLTDDVIVINDLLSSMYLVKGTDGYIAIDTGFREGIIKKGFQYNHINPNEVKTILLTHTDIDHQNAIGLFSYSKVYLSNAEYEMVNRKVNRFNFFPFFSNKIFVDKYSLLKDGEEIFISGRKIKCIALPGHTLGSMGFIVDGKYLFSGDAFKIKNGKIALPFRKYFTMDSEEMRNSLKKVANLDGIKYIFSANSGFTADFKFAVSDWK